jgi:hypothetical protein
MRLLEIYQNLPEGTWNGDHPPAGDVADANCVMVQEMGSHAHLDTNQAIIARTICQRSQGETGTLGELKQYKAEREANPGAYDRPALLTNNRNVGNILRQAKILGVDEGIIVPDKLPRNFDIRSLLYGQPWTASELLWRLGAGPRDYLLKRKGH